MARVMEKVGARRLGSSAQARQIVKGKVKVSRPSVVPKPAAPAAKVIKVMPRVKKERASSRPAGTAVAERVAPRGVVTPLAPVARTEAVRVNGSEHGAAVSRTDHLKARFAALSAATAQIKALKRSLPKNFFDIGLNLQRIRDEKLYEVKGYGSFESFVEREVDLDKVLCSRLARMPKMLNREGALEVGFERACAAMAVLEGEAFAPSPVAVYPVHSTVSNTLPAHKR
ncbi:MAG TPA: hypothetical protein VF331_01535 [Polyangiales bacterium]